MAKILVIEDDPAIRENIITLLECEGYEVIEASTGEEGARLAASELPDLVICDVVMPEGDGYFVIQQIRQNQNQEIALTPFIFLSARVEKTSTQFGLELGANDYLKKPFTVLDLISAVAFSLEPRQVPTELIQSNNEAQSEIHD